MKKLLLVTISVSILLLGGFYFLKAQKQSQQEQKPLTQREQVQLGDIERLSAEGSEAERAKSLLRLSEQKPESAKPFAREFVRHASPILRAAAYQAVGGFVGTEWDTLISEGLRDTDENVRVGTLRGIARQPTAYRTELLNWFLQSERRPHETGWAYFALMKATSDFKNKDSYRQKVLLNLQKLNGELRSELLVEMYKTWPGHNDFLPFAESALRMGMDDVAFMPSFRYLSEGHPEVLAKILLSMPWPDSRSFLIYVTEFAQRNCAHKGLELIKKIKAHPRSDNEINDKIKAEDCSALSARNQISKQ